MLNLAKKIGETIATLEKDLQTVGQKKSEKQIYLEKQIEKVEELDNNLRLLKGSFFFFSISFLFFCFHFFLRS